MGELSRSATRAARIGLSGSAANRLLAACAEPGNNTCFSTENLNAEQTGWFIEAADDWNVFETLAQAEQEGTDPPDEPIEFLTVNDSCAKVGFGKIENPRSIGYYNGRTIIFSDLVEWLRCAPLTEPSKSFASTARHELGHALGYCRTRDCTDQNPEDVAHSLNPCSIMHGPSPWCTNLADNPP